MDDTAFDWVALAPIDHVMACADEVWAAAAVRASWLGNIPDGMRMESCRLTDDAGTHLAILTLQGYALDQTHLRLEPTAAALPLVAALFAALRGHGWMPGAGTAAAEVPHFMRPVGFRPRPPT